jgi:hypothetical protein
MPAEVTKIPLRLSNGVLVEQTESSIAAAERIKKQLNRQQRNESRTETNAFNHRRYLHAQSQIEEYLNTELPERVYSNAEINAYVQQRIQDFAPTALDVLEDIITGKLPASLALRAKYAHLHLCRAGYPPITKVSSISGTLTREDIEALKQRATQSKEESGEN